MRPSLDTVPGTGAFLYDRDCGFCKRSVVFARDRLRARSRFVAWQDFDLDSAGLTPEQADASAWFVYADGRRFSGGDAVAELLLHGRPLTRPLGRLARLPLLRALNRAAYRWVAANRHRIPLPGGAPSCGLGPLDRTDDPAPP
jgi:predicted DCC family thiol-disulfide oxidoreductase YuxK